MKQFWIMLAIQLLGFAMLLGRLDAVSIFFSVAIALIAAGALEHKEH